MAFSQPFFFPASLANSRVTFPALLYGWCAWYLQIEFGNVPWFVGLVVFCPVCKNQWCNTKVSMCKVTVRRLGKVREEADHLTYIHMCSGFVAEDLGRRRGPCTHT